MKLYFEARVSNPTVVRCFLISNGASGISVGNIYRVGSNYEIMIHTISHI